jgi:hypothetical protein|tara:strand:- start:59 stop:316 length:258 start_codon:yes stop_codon:yes gene_type:complete
MAKKEKKLTTEEMEYLYENDKPEFVRQQSMNNATRSGMGDGVGEIYDEVKGNVKKLVKKVIKRKSGGSAKGTQGQTSGKKFSGIY